MESLAPPGTEDNITSATPATFISKKNSETDRLLSLRYPLPDGSTSNVFELTWQNGNEIWYCRVCRCPVMGQVFNHEGGKRHVGALEAASTTRRAASFKVTSAAKGADWEDVHAARMMNQQIEEVRVAPGEPVPPGFEGEITKVAQIQERLDNFKTSSLIGLEYLLELQDYDQDREPSYFCLLCGKKGDFRTIIPHLVSYNHLQTYLQRHYLKTYTALAPFSTHKKYKKCWQECLTKIADAIEAKYGRMLPHPIDMETYERNKQEVYNKVNNGPHFSESNGVDFEELVDQNEIIRLSNKAFMDEHNQEKKTNNFVSSRDNYRKQDTKSRNRRSLSSVSSISSDDFDTSATDRNRGSQRQSRPTTSTLYNRRRHTRSRTRSRSRSPYKRGERGEDSMPWNRPEYKKSEYSTKDSRRSREDDRESKKDKFRRLAAAIEKDMEPQLRKHQMNPEKHPHYNEEWKIFWNKRYKELQIEGKDTQGYDFKPEWIIYWNKKMEEFHKSAVKQAIEALRRRLGLAEVVPISFKINTASTTPSRRRERKLGCQPVAAQPDQDHEVIIIDDSRDDKGRSRDGSHSPWESDTNNSPRKDTRRRPLTARRRSKSKSRSLSPYRRRSYGRRRSRSRSGSRSKTQRYRRTRSRTKSPLNRRDDNKATGTRRSAEWERAVYNTKQLTSNIAIPFSSSGKDIVMVRESTLKKQEMLDEELTAVEDLGADVNIVAVLRLLTALEDKLGSLGPKVVELLAMALSMEKKSPNSSEQLLEEESNCVMFETIKEKLKGLLHAGLITGYSSQEKAIKISITKIAGLLHLASTNKAKKASKINVDKVAIAQQIANALVIQGKSDVTQAELEQLVDAVVQMAEASKDSEKPMKTANFLEMIKQSKPEPSKLIPDSDKPAKVLDVEPEKDASIIPKDAMDGLSDLELQTLLQSFKDLSAEEQHGLISYLKKLEAKEPARVETLRKFVNTESTSAVGNVIKTEDSLNTSGSSGRISPFSKKLSENSSKPLSIVPQNKLAKETKVDISDDEEDYSYEDVFKAASKNLTMKEEPKDMSNVIANIMGSIAANTNTSTTATTTLANLNKPVGKNMASLQTPSQSMQPTSHQLQPQHQQPQQQQGLGFNFNGKGNINLNNLSNYQARPHQMPQQQQQFRPFPHNGPQRPQMQGNMPPQMQNMRHNFQDNMPPRFYPSNIGNNMDQNLNNNQNYNYYNNRW